MAKEDPKIYYRTLNLTGVVQEGIDGRIVLLCNEYPISGVGESAEDALQSLLRCFRLHVEAEASVKGSSLAVLAAEATPLEFGIAMSYPSPEESKHEPVAPLR